VDWDSFLSGLGRIVERMKICALIPAFNEAHFIAWVVEETKRHIDTVVVIDDGRELRASGSR